MMMVRVSLCTTLTDPTSAHPLERAGAATTMMRRHDRTFMAESPREKNSRRSSVA
jgi:hypothetical protein